MIPHGGSASSSTGYPFLDGDDAVGLALDPLGNPLITGNTVSTDFPITANAYQHTNKDRNGATCFVSKLSTDGENLLYSTYLGGSDLDLSSGIALGTSGAPAVAGEAQSGDFPLTPGSYGYGGQGSYGSTFITKLPTPAPALAALTPALARIPCGLPDNIRVAMSAQAQIYSDTVTLSSSAPSQLSVPYVVHIPVGQVSIVATATSHPVSSDSSITITGTFAGASKTCSVTVLAGQLRALNLALSSIVGGRNTFGEVYLTGQAGPTGDSISLRSSDPSVEVPPL